MCFAGSTEANTSLQIVHYKLPGHDEGVRIIRKKDGQVVLDHTMIYHILQSVNWKFGHCSEKVTDDVCGKYIGVKLFLCDNLISKCTMCQLSKSKKQLKEATNLIIYFYNIQQNSCNF